MAASSSSSAAYDPNIQFKTACLALASQLLTSVELSAKTESGKCISTFPLKVPIVDQSCKVNASLIYTGPDNLGPKPNAAKGVVGPKQVNPHEIFSAKALEEIEKWDFNEMGGDTEYCCWTMVSKKIVSEDLTLEFLYHGPNQDPKVEQAKGNSGKGEYNECSGDMRKLLEEMKAEGKSFEDFEKHMRQHPNWRDQYVKERQISAQGGGGENA